MDRKMAGYGEMEQKAKDQEAEKEALKGEIVVRSCSLVVKTLDQDSLGSGSNPYLLQKLQDSVAEQEERGGDITKTRKQLDREIDDLKKQVSISSI